MSKIKTEIKQLLLVARKAKLKTDIPFFQTVLGEIENKIGKEPTDEEILKLFKSMKKDALKCNNLDEAKFYNGYLPSLMNEVEIYGALDKMDLPEGSKIGDYMAMWNKTPALKGKADMKQVGTIIREKFL